jgi:hypothetical protein
MGKHKRRRPAARGGLGFVRNMTAGGYSPLERARRVAGNLLRRGARRQVCCGNYGDPGC